MFHGIFLGVGAHKDSRLPKVPSARRDAEAMYAVVSRATMDEQRHLTLLVDQRVTKAALGRFLGEELPSRVTIKDTVLIYLAGLGTVDPSDGSMLLLTHESAADKPRAQSIEVIAEMMLWMRRMSARIVTLILDASFATGRAQRRVFARSISRRRPLPRLRSAPRRPPRDPRFVRATLLSRPRDAGPRRRSETASSSSVLRAKRSPPSMTTAASTGSSPVTSSTRSRRRRSEAPSHRRIYTSRRR